IATTNEKTKEKFKEKAEIWKVKKHKDGKVDLVQLLKKAGENQIASLLVEGGSKVFTSFLKEKLVDKIYYFLSPKILGKGLDSFDDLGIKEISDSITLRDCEIKRFNNDLLIIGYPSWSSDTCVASFLPSPLGGEG
ncbi:MAG: dihydrofolate reductase family protein, partial [candidate division Zixibacteria bacterium]|nr:dihydrofolate reductase family protein [candidate division Zixibacteria bacterium]